MRAALLLPLLAGCFPELDNVDFDDTGTRESDVVAGGHTDAGDDTDADTDVVAPRDTAPSVLGADELVAGNLAITEVHVDPEGCARADGQYLEVLNFTAQDVNLRGLRVAIGGSNFTVSPDADLPVATGEYVVGAVEGASCPYTDALGARFTIPSGRTVPVAGTTIALKTPGGVVVDSVDLRTLRLGGASAVTQPGRAVHLLNGVWCMAEKVLVPGGDDYGSPREAAQRCL